MPLETDRQKTAHLLRRFGFGASEAEVEFYVAGGYARAVARLTGLDAAPDPFDVPLDRLANARGQINVRGVQAHWLLRLAVTQRPLQEKLTLFWHDHFAVGAQKVDVPLAMHGYVETLRRNALGGFQELTLAALQTPAMVYWLDNHLNVKGRPNENFAREVLELFTLGIGRYSERDVQEAARAFTGWGFGVGPGLRPAERPVRGARFVFREDRHDAGSKTILGREGAWNGQDVVRKACEHPQTARHLVTKLWEWFVYPRPEPALVERIATGWRENGLSIRWLVRAIMLSPEFVSERAERALFKSPVDFTLATYRQLGIGQRALQAVRGAEAGQVARAVAPLTPLLQAGRAMGMELLFPPDVAGWEGGAAWISTATMIERIKWAQRIFGAPERGRPALRFPAAGLFQGLQDPGDAVRRLLELFDAGVPPARQGPLVSAAREASQGEVSAANANATALAVCRLLFGMPEFQML
jgi:uncharacterized protein (DUF1800 family)